MELKLLRAVAPIVIIFSSVFCSCLSMQSNDAYNDFSTTGFIAGNCYQSIIEFRPEASAHGLVMQRESASEKMKSRDSIDAIALDNLVNYCLDNAMSMHSKDTNKVSGDLNSYKSTLKAALQSYLSYGKIAYTYFREDNSIVVIHRIERNRLKERINEIDIFSNENKN